MGLSEYRRKRDFKETSEPAGGVRAGASKNSPPMFVVQKHAASHLHYDFRLQMEGVLKSWAVPKGFPMKNGERRLAMHVEDHPIEYANFEGTIAPGNYGAGTVMVWDRGAYMVHGTDPVKALEQGKLHLTLVGKKLKGGWTLVRMRHPREEGRDQWLLLKTDGDAKPISPKVESCSVLTKRSMERIASDNDAQWQSNRPASRAPVQNPPVAKPKAAAPVLELPRGLPRAKAAFVEPMKALLVDALPKGSDWIYELKFDGYRALAIKNKAKVALISRNSISLAPRYPEVVEALKQLPCTSAVLDGELVAVDSEGRSSFQLLQNYQSRPTKPPLLYYVFDLLNLDGRSLLKLPLGERKQLLQRLLEDAPDTIRFSAALNAPAERLMKEMSKRGLEGLIAKLRDSKYEPGRRSGAWVKFKWSNEQEFVIGGYTPPKGARGFFGAILVGYYEGKKLLFASKVGSGFDTKTLKSLYDCFQKHLRPDCPFANLPENIPGGMSAAEMRTCTWLQPELVCQVRFTEWTRDHHLRHPLFLGLREDKAATEVVRERPS